MRSNAEPSFWYEEKPARPGARRCVRAVAAGLGFTVDTAREKSSAAYHPGLPGAPLGEGGSACPWPAHLANLA